MLGKVRHRGLYLITLLLKLQIEVSQVMKIRRSQLCQSHRQTLESSAEEENLSSAIVEPLSHPFLMIRSRNIIS